MSKTLPVPTNSDYVFKRIFGDERNIDSLHAFLQAVLDVEEQQLGEIQILNPYVAPESYNDKFGILDLKVKTNEGKIINVEIQLQREASYHSRIIYYLSKMIYQQMKSGEEYDVIQKVISISILDHDFVKKSNSYHHTFQLYDPYHKIPFGDIIEVHTLELPKLPDTHDGTKLWDWLAFFKSKDESQLRSLANHNQEVAKVVSAYKNMTVEEIEQIKEWESDRAARNKAQFIADAKRKAAAEGMAEGMAKGLAEGASRSKNEIALRLLNANLSAKQVSEWTGLSLEEIDALNSQ